MTIPVELETILDDIYRKIGRNVVMLQSVESMLKKLLAQHTYVGASKEAIEEHLRVRRKDVELSTLGGLVTRFTSEVLEEIGREYEIAPKHALAGNNVFRYTIVAEKDYINKRITLLQSIVDDRNQLVHHFQSRLGDLSVQSARKIVVWLDELEVRVADEAKTIKKHLEGMARTASFARAAMALPSFEELSEKWVLQDSQIAVLLGGLSRGATRAEGWVRLAHAKPFLRKEAKREMNSMKEIYGHSDLEQLLIATDVFELDLRALNGGAPELCVRLKPGCEDRYDAITHKSKKHAAYLDEGEP